MSQSELQSLRGEMDAVNERLVDVLHERARLCRRIAAWKRAHGQPAADPAREEAMLAALLRAAPGDGFARDELAAILRAVFATSRELVERSIR
jgi:3-deoxy-7-phosphoheptulonate synthase/chorismate mutase